jgi:hypothetical protein
MLWDSCFCDGMTDISFKEIPAFVGMTIKALAGVTRLVRSKREVTNKYKEGGLFFYGVLGG